MPTPQSDPFLQVLQDLRGRGVGPGVPTVSSGGRGGGPGPSLPSSRLLPVSPDDPDDPFLLALSELRGAVEDGRSSLARGYDAVFTPPAFVTDAASSAADAIDAPSEGRSRVGAMVRGFGAGVVQGAASLLTPGDVALTATGFGPLARGIRALRGGSQAVRAAQTGADVATAARGVERIASAESPSEALAGGAQVALGGAGVAAGRPSARPVQVPERLALPPAAPYEVAPDGVVTPPSRSASRVPAPTGAADDPFFAALLALRAGDDPSSVRSLPARAVSSDASGVRQYSSDPNAPDLPEAIEARVFDDPPADVPAHREVRGLLGPAPEWATLPVGANARKAPIQGRRKTPKAPIHAVVSEADERLAANLGLLRAEGYGTVADLSIDHLRSAASRGVSPDAPEAYQLAQLRAFNPIEMERLDSWVESRLADLPAKPRAVPPPTSRSDVLASGDLDIFAGMERLASHPSVTPEVRDRLLSEVSRFREEGITPDQLRQAAPDQYAALEMQQMRIREQLREIERLQPLSPKDASERMRLAPKPGSTDRATPDLPSSSLRLSSALDDFRAAKIEQDSSNLPSSLSPIERKIIEASRLPGAREHLTSLVDHVTAVKPGAATPKKKPKSATEQFRARVVAAFDKADPATQARLAKAWEEVQSPGMPAGLREDAKWHREHFSTLESSKARVWWNGYRRKHPEQAAAFDRLVDEVLAGGGSVSGSSDASALTLDNFAQRVVAAYKGGDAKLRKALETAWHQAIWPELEAPAMGLSRLINLKSKTDVDVFSVDSFARALDEQRAGDLDSLIASIQRTLSGDSSSPIGRLVSDSESPDALFLRKWNEVRKLSGESGKWIDDLLGKRYARAQEDLPPGSSPLKVIAALRADEGFDAGHFDWYEKRLDKALSDAGVVLPPVARPDALPKGAGANVRPITASSATSTEKQFIQFVRGLTPTDRKGVTDSLSGKPTPSVSGKVLDAAKRFQSKDPKAEGYIRPELLAQIASGGLGALVGGVSGAASIDEDDPTWEKALKVFTGAAVGAGAGVGAVVGLRRARQSALLSDVDLPAADSDSAAVAASPIYAVDRHLDRFKNPLVRYGVRERLAVHGAFPDGRKSGPVSPVVSKLALQLGHEARKRGDGKSVNTATLTAYARAMRQAHGRISELSGRVNAGRATDIDLLSLELARADADLMRGSLLSAPSVSARALASVRAYSRAIDSGNLESIREMADLIRPETVTFARKWSDLPVDDVARHRWLTKDAQPSFRDRAMSYYYSNILSGIKTHERNVFGNVFNGLGNLVSHPFAAGLDAVVSKASGRPRQVRFSELPHGVMGMYAGMDRAFADAVFTARYGVNPIALQKTVRAAEVGKMDVYSPEFAGGGANPFNWPRRALDSTDAFFRSFARNGELYEAAYTAARNEGLTSKDAIRERMEELISGSLPESVELREQAEHVAARAVFQEKGGPLVRFLSKGYQLPIVGPVVTVTMPFLRTPMNILKQGAEASVLGFVMKEGRRADRSGSLARGRATMGTLASGYLMYLAASGRLSGDGPTDAKERARLYETGWRPHSVRIGDQWVDTALFQPVSVQAAVIANAFEAWQGDGSTEDGARQTFQNVMSAVGDSVAQQSFLDGLFALQGAISGGSWEGSRFVGRVASGFVPFSSFQRSIAHGSDPVVRRPSSASDYVKAGIPGLSDDLPARLDRYGEDIRREGGPVRRMADPFNVSAVRSDAVSDELSRLGVNLPELSATMKLPRDRRLTDDEKHRVRQAQGREMRDALEKVMAQRNYQRFPDKLRSSLLSKAIDQSRESLRRRVIDDVLRGRSILSNSPVAAAR